MRKQGETGQEAEGGLKLWQRYNSSSSQLTGSTEAGMFLQRFAKWRQENWTFVSINGCGLSFGKRYELGHTAPFGLGQFLDRVTPEEMNGLALIKAWGCTPQNLVHFTPTTQICLLHIVNLSSLGRLTPFWLVSFAGQTFKRKFGWAPPPVRTADLKAPPDHHHLHS